MKQIFTILVMVLVSYRNAACAQQNTLTLGTFILHTADFTLSHAALGFYHQASEHQALGLKAMWYTDEIGNKENQINNSILNIDLVQRWTFKKAQKRTRWNLDAGISAAWTIQKFPPMKQWGFCGAGMS